MASLNLTNATDSPTFKNNVPNTTLSWSGGDHQYVVKLQLEDGYEFDGTITASYMGSSSGFPCSADLAISDNVASGVLVDVNENIAITLSGKTKEKEKTLTIVNNIENSKETYTYDGTTLNLTVQATSTKVQFQTAPTVTFLNKETGFLETVNMEIQETEDTATATATITNINISTNVILNGTLSDITIVTTSFSNCTSESNIPKYLFAGESLSVTIQANTNTLFETAPTFQFLNEQGFYETQNLTVSEDKKTAAGSFTVPTSYTPQTLLITATATPQKIVGPNYGAINVYKVTLDNLDAFSKKRFIKEQQTDGTVTLVNLGNYVNRIKRLYFNVPTEATDTIRCGNYNTSIQCEAPNTDIVTLDFGTITLPMPNNDTTDYQSDIQLFLPFKGFINIPSDYMGNTINLIYNINIVTGGGVAKVICNENIILLENVQPCNDILYRTSDEEYATIGSDNWNEEYMYGLEPFVYLKYYSSLNTAQRNSDYTRVTSISKLPKGFYKFQNIEQDTEGAISSITQEEYEEIINLLQEGVYII